MGAMKQNAEQIRWARRYQTALGKHLKLGKVISLKPALALGSQAVAIRMETLDVAKLHEQTILAFAKRKISSGAGVIDRAKNFFLETIVPIEKTHHAAVKNDLRIKSVTRALHLRTSESSAAAKRLGLGVANRKAAEIRLNKNGGHLTNLLKNSDRLQKQLRKQTHEKLSAQEKIRYYASRRLHDEIAQALLAINLRLLTLKMSAKSSSERLKREIAETQRMVKQTVKTIRRLADEVDHYHEA